MRIGHGLGTLCLYAYTRQTILLLSTRMPFPQGSCALLREPLWIIPTLDWGITFHLPGMVIFYLYIIVKRLLNLFPCTDSFYVFNIPSTPIESIRLPLSKLPTLDLFEEVLHAPARTNPLVELSSERSGWSLTFDSNRAFFKLDGKRAVYRSSSLCRAGCSVLFRQLFRWHGVPKTYSWMGWAGRRWLWSKQ